MTTFTRPTLVLLCAAVAISARPPQRAPFRALKLAEDWTIDSRTQQIGSTMWISIAPDGRVIAAPGFNQGYITAFDSLGTKELWRVPIGRNRDLEILYVNRVGWTGNQLWISDRGYDQIALIDDKGKVTKSLALPAFARPLLSDRKKYPVLTSMDPIARYSDGSMLVRPVDKANVFETPEFDSTSTSLIRVSSGGIIQGTTASYPPEQSVSFSVSGTTERRPIPMQARTIWNVSPDGMRLVFITTSLSGPDSATFRVVSLSDRGDTVFAKKFPFAPMPISKTQKDSALARVQGVRGVAIQQVRFALAPKMPKHFAPVVSALVGRDYTTWIAMRAPAGDTTNTPWLILDPKGDAVGVTQAPRRTVMLAVDRSHAWGVRRGNNVERYQNPYAVRFLTRYRVIE